MISSVLSYVKRRLAPQPVKIRADIEVTCFNYEGIDAIKAALLEGESKGTPEAIVKIKLIAPPLYVMTTMSLDKEYGIDTLNKSIAAVGAMITAKGYVSEHFNALRHFPINNTYPRIHLQWFYGC
jgi:translation initiation factor 2 subunit 1